MKMRLIACLAASCSAYAFGMGPAVQMGDMCDPCVPPEVRAKAAATPYTPKRGEALRAQVEQRLRVPFEAAARDGLLTREAAAAAGLGFIASHFDAIDRSGRGAIRFEDYKAFLKERGAALD